MAKRSISSKKRARQAERRREINRTKKLNLKKAIKELKAAKTQKTAQSILRKTQALIDKSAQKGVIHKNKAARIKSRLSAYIVKLK